MSASGKYRLVKLWKIKIISYEPLMINRICNARCMHSMNYYTFRCNNLIKSISLNIYKWVSFGLRVFVSAVFPGWSKRDNSAVVCTKLECKLSNQLSGSIQIDIAGRIATKLERHKSLLKHIKTEHLVLFNTSLVAVLSYGCC